MRKNHWLLRKIRKTKVNIISTISSCLFRYDVGKSWYKCCRMGKHPKISSSTYWIEIRRKHCSEADGILNSNCQIWHIYNYFTFVRLPIHLGVNNIPAKVVLSNSNTLSLGTNSCKKRNVTTLNNAHQAKNSVTLTVAS